MAQIKKLPDLGAEIAAVLRFHDQANIPQAIYPYELTAHYAAILRAYGQSLHGSHIHAAWSGWYSAHMGSHFMAELPWNGLDDTIKKLFQEIAAAIRDIDIYVDDDQA